MTQPSRIEVPGGSLAVDLWPGTGPALVFLHPGVADRRCWTGTAELLAGRRRVAYDRRGFGQSAPGPGDFSHADDLVRVLEQLGAEPAWLVGGSAGGAVALDVAVTRPELVAGLVLVGPAVTGAPAPDDAALDAATARLSDRLDAALEAGDTAAVNRVEAWLWLDGPAGPEGRVQGPVRELFLDMNAVVLAHGLPESAGGSDTAAWDRLAAVQVPTTVVWGELDVPFLLERYAELAARLPRSRTRVLPGTAHLPQLEQPQAVADVVREAVDDAPAPGG